MFRRLTPVLTAGSLVLGLLLAGGQPATAAEAIGAPSGLAVSTSGGDLRLSWQPPDGATAYRIQVSSDTTDSSATLVKDVNTYAPRYVVPDAIDNNQSRRLYWRVAAYSSGTSSSAQGAYTDWAVLGDRDPLGAPQTVSPGSTDPSEPETVSHPAPVTFRWNPVRGATQYTVQYATSADFSTGLVTMPAVTGTSTTPTAPLARTSGSSRVVWYWRVKADFGLRKDDRVATSSTNVSGVYSAARAFEVIWSAKPTLLNPVDTTKNFSDLRFTWTPVAGAESYRVDFATGYEEGSDSLTGEVTSATVYGTTWVPTTTLLNTDYWWRVTPFDSDKKAGTQSAVASFRKYWGEQTEESLVRATAKAAYPEPHQGNSDPLDPTPIPIEDFELSWDPIPRATFYQVELAPTNGGTVLTCNTASTSATVVAKSTASQGSGELLKGSDTCLWHGTAGNRVKVDQLYRWRVRGVDLSGAETTSIQTSPLPAKTLWSPWSAPQSGESEQVRYVVPVEGSAPLTDWSDMVTDETLLGQPAPLFDWEPVVDAKLYRVEIYRDPEMTNEVARILTTQTRLRSNGVFTDNNTDQPYFWNVTPLKTDSLTDQISIDPGTSGLQQWTKLSKRITFDQVDPVQTLDDGTVLLRWDPQFVSAPLDGGSRGYQVYVYDRSNTLIGSEKVEYPFYAAQNPVSKKPLPAGDEYKFRVAPLDANGTPGKALSVYTPGDPFTPFDVPAYAPTSPTSTVGASSVALAWTPKSGASSYSVTYGVQDSGTTTTQTPTQAGVSISDLPPATYSWTVRSKDIAGNLSKPTAAQTFTVAAASPAPVTVTGSVLDPTTGLLDWNPVAGASRYLVKIATSEANLTTTPIVVAETSATSYVPTVSLNYPTIYYWTVTAVPEKASTSTNRTGLGTSPVRTFTVTTAPTGAPTVSTPVVTGTSANVTWSEPNAAAKGTGSGVTYDVRYRAVPTGIETAWVTKNVSDSLSWTVTALPVNTSFELQVRLRTGLGTGPWSPVKTFKTAGVPGVVSNLSTTVKSTGIRVSWSSPSSNGGSAVTGYVVSYRKSGGSWSTVNAASTYADLTSLAGGTAYEITVKAKNAVGTGPAATITATSIGAPSAPTSVKAARGSGSAKITWGAPTNSGGTPVTGYAVQLRYYKSGWSSWSTKVNTTASARSASLTGLVNGRKYEVRVVAKNAVATGKASGAVGFVPATKPGAPTKVKATSLTKKIKVSWAKPSSNGSTLKGYTIRYSADRKNWKTLKTITSPSTLSYTWKATKRKKAYFFQVKANSNLGSSKYSAYVLGVAK